MTAPARQPRGLLHEVSRAVFWNTVLLPLVTAVGVLLSILIRRSFGLESGLYDVVLGVSSSILFYTSLGLAGSLPRFLPELQIRNGRRAATALIWRLGTVRVGLVMLILLPLNVWAASFADALHLGADGGVYLRWLSLLLVGRAILDFLYRALDSFLQQLSVNTLSLVNGLLDVLLAAAAIGAGLGIAGVVGALGISSIATAILAAAIVARYVAGIPEANGDHAAPSAERVWKLSALTYVRDLSLYFATPAFASPVLLSVMGGPEPVALFATSYFVAASTVALVVSGFRGIYRPAFARVLAVERDQLGRTFDLMNKVQVLTVVPAGFGLAVMVGDYLPLLFGQAFGPAVPVARVLIFLLFAETALAVALLVLWADERHGPVLAAQAVTVVAAPLFIWTAGRFGLIAAGWVLGGSRVASVLIGYAIARHEYGVRFPWSFAAKVTLVSAMMAVVLAAIREVWPTSLMEAAALTAAGVIIVALGLRALRVLGPTELDVIRRASVPGKHLLVDWLTPRETT